MATLTRALYRWRVAAAGLAAVLALAFFVATPTGQIAAADFLAQFRSQRFTVISFDPNSDRHEAMLSLEEMGRVETTRDREVEARTVAETGRRLGITVREPDPATLPDGVSGDPQIQVMPANVTRFTFDRAKAQRHFDSIGERNVELPEQFDGATLVISVPAVVTLQYSGGENSMGLAVAQSNGLLTADVEGNVTMDEMRDFLLGLPGLPPDMVRQLRAVRDWRTTLPIPVPADQIDWEDTVVNGNPGLLFNDNSGLMSAVLWQQDDQVFAVAGTLKAREIQRVASSLR